MSKAVLNIELFESNGMVSGGCRHHCRCMGRPRARRSDGGFLLGPVTGPVDGTDHRGITRRTSWMEKYAVVPCGLWSHPGCVHLLRLTRNAESGQTVSGGDAEHHRELGEQWKRIGQD